MHLSSNASIEWYLQVNSFWYKSYIFGCIKPKLPQYVQLEPIMVDGEEVKDEVINVGCAVKFSNQERMQL